MFAGGAIEMKPRISGRRISSCMPIQAPKLTPATQVVSASGWILLHPVERAGGVGQFANAVVEHALALANATEVEPQRRKAAPHEGLVEQLDDLVVHRPAGLRVRMEDQRDRRARTSAGMESAFKAAFGTRKNDFGHRGWAAHLREMGRAPLLAFSMRVRRGGGVLYRGGFDGNQQESQRF